MEFKYFWWWPNGELCKPQVIRVHTKEKQCFKSYLKYFSYIVLCQNTYVYKDSDYLEDLLSRWILIQQVWGGAGESAFLTALTWCWCWWYVDHVLSSKRLGQSPTVHHHHLSGDSDAPSYDSHAANRTIILKHGFSSISLPQTMVTISWLLAQAC